VAAVTVFVDDAVRGDLPSVCVRTGAPATTRVTVDAPVGGGLGLLWLLVLAGPLGLLALLFVAVSRSGRETLAVKLPYSDAAYEKERSLRRARDLALVATFIFILAALIGVLDTRAVWAALAAAGLVASLVMHARLDFRSVDISLDGSRRWVRLSNVNPAFAEAVERSVPADHQLPRS
jgi:hypothetical protein